MHKNLQSTCNNKRHNRQSTSGAYEIAMCGFHKPGPDVSIENNWHDIASMMQQ